MLTLETLEYWLLAQAETEHLEFKAAATQYDERKLLRYVIALANEGGGYFVLGVDDKLPRRVLGSQAFTKVSELNHLKKRIFESINVKVETFELMHPAGRVLAFEIPSRPIGTPLALEGAYFMRAGESTVAMSADQLRKIMDEGKPNWLESPAKENASAEEIIALLDTSLYFKLLKLDYPSTQDKVIDFLRKELLIKPSGKGWVISNLAAILLAQNLEDISPLIANKAPRIIVYDGVSKTKTRDNGDKQGRRGYVAGFEGLLSIVDAASPLNKSVEHVIRSDVKMFPTQALRELIANAMVHQDFAQQGASLKIEIFSDRVEITNLGLPSIDTSLFINESRVRPENERLARHMRQLGLCEDKGSGIDKVIEAVEAHHLPAPTWRTDTFHTIVTLFAEKPFSEMDKDDRMLACYQHCCLMFASNRRMTNQSLRARFALDEDKASLVSVVIANAKNANLIKEVSQAKSLRYMSYLPYWS